MLLGSAASGAVGGWLCVMVTSAGWTVLGSQTLKSAGFAVALVGGSAAVAFHFGDARCALAAILAANGAALARLTFDGKLNGST